MALEQLTGSVATSLANPDRLPQLEIRQVINRKAPIKFSTILVMKQIVFLLGWVTTRAKTDGRTQWSPILSFKGKYMFSPKASRIVTLKSMLRGDHSHRDSLGGQVSEHRWARNCWPRMAWGWAVPWWLLQRTQWMIRVWAIAGFMVNSLSRKTQLCGAQCAHNPTLYHRLHGDCATKDIWLRNCAILFGIFSSKCSSSKTGDGKKKATRTS